MLKNKAKGYKRASFLNTLAVVGSRLTAPIPWSTSTARRGTAITHAPGSPVIGLAPNQFYTVSYTLTLTNIGAANVFGILLFSSGGRPIGPFSVRYTIPAKSTRIISSTAIVSTVGATARTNWTLRSIPRSNQVRVRGGFLSAVKLK